MTDTSTPYAPTSDDDLRQKLTPEQYRVTQEAGTEQAFTGPYWDEKRAGLYRCIVCEVELFRSETKYDSGTGWPSFYAPIKPEVVGEKVDASMGAVRTESVCGNCGGHLGHVFPDGPQPTGLRYCMNGTALSFTPDK